VQARDEGGAGKGREACKKVAKGFVDEGKGQCSKGRGERKRGGEEGVGKGL
jgi:hypothetical protein